MSLTFDPSVPLLAAVPITMLLFFIGYSLGKRNGGEEVSERIREQAYSTGAINFGISEAYSVRRIQDSDLDTKVIRDED